MLRLIDFRAKVRRIVRYCICGKAIPRRKEKGGREQEYCSDKCRQRAYRERNQDRFYIEKLIKKLHPYPFLGDVELELQREINRLHEYNSHLRFELMMLNEHELPAKEREIEELENKLHYAILHSDYLQSQLADRDAEIIRLNMLLDSQSKKHKR